MAKANNRRADGARCSRCGREFPRPCSEYVPAEDDAVVCLKCGEVHLFDSRLRIVKAPDGHRARLRSAVRRLQEQIWRVN